MTDGSNNESVTNRRIKELEAEIAHERKGLAPANITVKEWLKFKGKMDTLAFHLGYGKDESAHAYYPSRLHAFDELLARLEKLEKKNDAATLSTEVK